MSTLGAESAATLLTGWGRTVPTRAELRRPEAAGEVERLLEDASERGTIPRGLGRSYGDAAQNAGGRVLLTTGLDGLHDIDLDEGRVTAGAGASIDTLIRTLVPAGWFLPVTPGTRHVTVGGAIAADVHGKNQHRDGNLADHVESFTLVTSDGRRVQVTPEGEPDAFAATAGGMGLTGVIVEATLRLLRIESAHVRVDRERAGDLHDVMARMVEGDDAYRYSVAWIDCLARGGSLGRSVLIRGDHAGSEDLPSGRRNPLDVPDRRALPAPPWVPSGLLGRTTARAFNELYFRRAPRSERGRVESLDAFFYPLDALDGWPRLYGARGFLQYQLVLPFGREAELRDVLERVSGAGPGSFLAVLKRFGRGGRGHLSFPIPGWTLALDLPAAPGVARLLDDLDLLVAGAGGRVYLAKDSRLRPELVATMYPRLREWREARARLDPGGVMTSDLSRRLGLG